MEETYKVQEIMEWWSNFEDNTIKIKSKNKEFTIELNKEQLPHLLGMQYTRISKNNKFIKGKELYKYIKNNKLSDQKIYELVESNNSNSGYILNNVKDRVNTFEYFMKNLETGIIVDKTFEDTKVKSSDLIIELYNNQFLHLGLLKNKDKDTLLEFKVEKDLKVFMETYFVRKDNRYFGIIEDIEKIQGIYLVKEKDKLVPFSFDEKKNKKLLKEYKKEQAKSKKEKEMER